MLSLDFSESKQLVVMPKTNPPSGGFLHIFFEGYFVLNHKDMPLKQDLFGQLWKEYALSDSRYMTADPLVLCMETLTAVVISPISPILTPCSLS